MHGHMNVKCMQDHGECAVWAVFCIDENRISLDSLYIKHAE